MNKEQQVCSLELSKKLKELGVKDQSLYVYYPKEDGFALGNWNEPMPANIAEPNTEVYSAFTVAELGEMLPSDYVSGHTPNATGGEYACLNFIKFASACYHKKDSLDNIPEIIEPNEANARAKMLIYLSEKGLIKKSYEHTRFKEWHNNLPDKEDFHKAFDTDKEYLL